MTFDLPGLWGLCLLASPILALLLTAWAYARAEAMAQARPVAAPAHPQPAVRVSTPEPAAPSPPPAPPPPAPSPAARTPVPASAPAPRAPASQPAPSAPLPPAPAAAPRAAARPPVSEAKAIPPLPELPRPPFPKAPPSAESIAKRLAEAEAAGNASAIPDLKVAHGLALFREGRSSSEAANDVRGGLILALQQGQKLSQAHARVALGDLCKAGSDLTTACEHWQLARDIFAELKETQSRKDVETRIRQNGCPTDWVLNEF